MKAPLIIILIFVLIQKGIADNTLSLKYQDWNEDNDRIRVRSWYAEAGTSLSQNWEMGVVGMVDTITGSTPWGRPPSDQEQWLSSLEEERRAGGGIAPRPSLGWCDSWCDTGAGRGRSAT